MKNEFLAYVKTHRLLSKETRVLLAVSGGLDSMAMLHLFSNQSWNFEIAHCNFSLRGDNSKLDETLVRAEASKLGIKCHVRTFDTERIASDQKKGIQETARELRYNWFSSILEQHELDVVATAHHADDQIETVLLNIIRGCGMDGLAGMQPQHKNVIRPLLFVERKQLEAYAVLHEITFREDDSNQDVKYRRNFLRHQVIPLLLNMNPAFGRRMQENIHIWHSAKIVLTDHLDETLRQRLVKEGSIWKLRVEQHVSSPQVSLLLHHWLTQYGFNSTQISDMISALQSSHTGTQFLAGKFTCLVNRGEIHLQEQDGPSSAIRISREDSQVETPSGTLHLSYSDRIEDSYQSSDLQVACLDEAHLHYPLKLRQWSPGDYFYPLGMSGRQKLKKFLTDLKISRFEKKKVWLLESAGKICWVVGMRIDDRFKITEKTKKVIILKWE